MIRSDDSESFGKVFINYRKNDASGTLRPEALFVEVLADWLERSLGKGTVYLDTTLRPGEPYPDALRSRLAEAVVLVVVIHRQWLKDLKARKDTHRDWVHEEIATAIRSRIRLLPVVLDGAELPTHSELPSEIRSLADSQAVRLQFGALRDGVNAVLAEIELIVAPNMPDALVPVAPLPDRGRLVMIAIALSTCALVATIGAIIKAFPQVTNELDPAMGAAAFAALGMLYLVIVFLLSACRFLLRRTLSWIDEQFSKISDQELKKYAAAAFVVALIQAALATGKLGPSVNTIALVYVATVSLLVIVGARYLRRRELTPAWPRSFVRPAPAAVRKALVDLERRLEGQVEGWAAPLPLLRQREARCAINIIQGALETMAEDSNRTFRGWWRTRNPWLTVPHSVLAGATLVQATEALILQWVRKGPGMRSGALWLGGVGLTVGCYGGSLLLEYWIHRGEGGAIVQAAQERLATAMHSLVELSRPGLMATRRQTSSQK